MKINYIAPIAELSGYGEFARNVVAGLIAVGADVKVQPLQINRDGGTDAAIKPLLGRHTKPDLVVVNIVPTLFKQYRHPSAPTVGYSMWEADTLPEAWVEPCEQMAAVLVPSKHNYDVFKAALKTTVLLAPPPIDFTHFTGRVRKTREPNTPFVFYSIFQWTERKNPSGLIRAYWAAMTGHDDVVLRLKLYLRNQDPAELAKINAEVAALKSSVRLRHYPKIELITAPMSREEIIQFHLAGDCFVSATRGEGLGLGLIEAMALSTYCIAPKTSGHLDFISSYPGSYNCWSVDTVKSPCIGMCDYAPWYVGSMYWDEPNLHQLAEQFRLAFNKPDFPGLADEQLPRLAVAHQAAKDVRKQYDQITRAKQLVELLQPLCAQGFK